MDTYNDDDVNDYGDDSGNSEGGARRGFGDLDEEDKLSVNMDDIVDDDEEDAIDLSAKQKKSQVQATPAHAEETKDENNTSGSDD